MSDPLSRDPRADPQPGDVLVTAFRTRTVTRRWDFYGDDYVAFTWGNGAADRILLRNWRIWAKKARVERVGSAA
jgi:hypothetical protein